MNKLAEVFIKPLEQSIYVKPYTMSFVQNGTKRTWDLLTSHDSVAIIIYNISRNVLVLVKQFRPAVYVASIPKEDRLGAVDSKKYPASLGITIEFCAGIVDKNILLAEIAAEEIFEECGYKVHHSALEKVSTCRSGVGHSGAIQTLYYCEVTDDMKITDGGGVEDEIIEVIEMSLPEIKRHVCQDLVQSPPSFMYAVYWFLMNKAKET